MRFRHQNWIRISNTAFYSCLFTYLYRKTYLLRRTALESGCLVFLYEAVGNRFCFSNEAAWKKCVKPWMGSGLSDSMCVTCTRELNNAWRYLNIMTFKMTFITYLRPYTSWESDSRMVAYYLASQRRSISTEHCWILLAWSHCSR